MVSEWMDNGNINEFIRKHEEVNRAQLVSSRVFLCDYRYDWFQKMVDVAHGLEYLHGLRIVHGDLKGVRSLSRHPLQLPTDLMNQANILIKKDHRACLADFGLSTIVYAAPRAPTNGTLPLLTPETSTDSKTSLVPYTSGGTRRWMSPETLVPEMFGMEECRPSKQSDCYSFAMTVYEVCSRLVVLESSY